jgi:hypothetical protein
MDHTGGVDHLRAWGLPEHRAGVGGERAGLAEVISTIHHQDQRMAGHSVQELARASRARFYALPENDVHMAGVFKTKMQTPAVPAVPAVIDDPANGIVGVPSGPTFSPCPHLLSGLPWM